MLRTGDRLEVSETCIQWKSPDSSFGTGLDRGDTLIFLGETRLGAHRWSAPNVRLVKVMSKVGVGWVWSSMLDDEHGETVRVFDEP